MAMALAMLLMILLHLPMGFVALIGIGLRPVLLAVVVVDVAGLEVVWVTQMLVTMPMMSIDQMMA